MLLPWYEKTYWGLFFFALIATVLMVFTTRDPIALTLLFGAYLLSALVYGIGLRAGIYFSNSPFSWTVYSIAAALLALDLSWQLFSLFIVDRFAVSTIYIGTVVGFSGGLLVFLSTYLLREEQYQILAYSILSYFSIVTTCVVLAA